MDTFEVIHDGIKYHVQADSPEEAASVFKQSQQEEANAAAQKEFADTPMWAKPFVAGTDLLRTGMDDWSLGLSDWAAAKMGGRPTEDVRRETEAIRSRMGGADIAGSLAAGLATPTAVPSLVTRIGGGKAVRGLVGAGIAGIEGAAQGGASAYAHDQDIPSGAGIGAVSGPSGQALGWLASKVPNTIAKWWQGASDTLPAANPANKVGKGSAPAKRVERAVAAIEKEGGGQKEIEKKFRNISTKNMTPEQIGLVDQVARRAPGTVAADKIGNFIENTSPIASLSTGMADISTGIATRIGLGAATKGARVASEQGTREAVDNLRRSLLGIPKFQGPISPMMKDRMQRAARKGVLGFLDDYNQ